MQFIDLTVPGQSPSEQMTVIKRAERGREVGRSHEKVSLAFTQNTSQPSLINYGSFELAAEFSTSSRKARQKLSAKAGSIKIQALRALLIQMYYSRVVEKLVEC